MSFDFAVVGATGMQGKIVSKDLLENGYSVLMCGRDKTRVEKLLKSYRKTKFAYVDLRDIKKTSEVIKKSRAKVVVNCAEGDWNLNCLEACIKAKSNCIDLGSEVWMTRKQLAMHKKLKKRNLISITGCGSVPGVGNVMLRYASQKFDKIDSIDVGFAWDSNIKKFVVPFSIQSIIEEFSDPAQVMSNGKMIKKVPLKSITEKSFKAIGKQKCFFTRHPEVYTFYYYFKDKGLKDIKFYAGFPKHSFNTIMTMIELGLGSKKEMKFKDRKIKPVEFLTEVLKNLEIPQGYKETENLWVVIKGRKDRKEKKILMECIVPTLRGWEDAGCNIDTGMPASIMAQMIKTGIITEKGSFAPEGVVPPEPFFKELKKRKMLVYENGRQIN